MSEVREVAFYKQIGGYETYVKVNRRWYWVCSNGQPKLHLQFLNAGQQAGVKLVRQGKLPTPVYLAQCKYGANFATIKQVLPQWTERIGF